MCKIKLKRKKTKNPPHIGLSDSGFCSKPVLVSLNYKSKPDNRTATASQHTLRMNQRGEGWLISFC